MSTTINNIDMEDNFNHNAFIDAYNDRMKRLTDIAGEQQMNTYSERTCQVASPYAPHTSPTPPPIMSDDEVMIARLTEENKKLREDYAGLVKKANILVEAYRKLKTEIETVKTENETLKIKKIKRDSVTKVFTKVGKSGHNIYQQFIDWLKT